MSKRKVCLSGTTSERGRRRRRITTLDVFDVSGHFICKVKLGDSFRDVLERIGRYSSDVVIYRYIDFSIFTHFDVTRASDLYYIVSEL